MKSFLKVFLISLISLLIIINLTGCNKKDNNKLNQKVKEELQYLDLEIVTLINYANNITIENYKLAIQEVSLR